MIMNDWLHNLPIVWMALLVFGLTALVTAAIYLAVTVLSVGERARSFKAVSPGMLPPLAVLSALFIAFTASQVWTDNDRASAGVDREASALRSVVILAAAFPGESETRLRSLIRSYVGDAVAQEWPMMARRTATLQVIPYSLAEALQLTLALTPSSQGQQTAQREITTALENALDARRQRIIISHSQVNWVKWLCLALQAVCALLAIAMVHSDDRLACDRNGPLWDWGGRVFAIDPRSRPTVYRRTLGQARPAAPGDAGARIQSARDQALIPLFSSISYSTAPARLTGISSAIPAMLGEPSV